MQSLGEIIRKLREQKELPLRTVAAFLDIDQAILSKIERGQRNASREQVIKLADYFKVKENDLLIAWLADKLVYTLAGEELGFEALQAAEERVSYGLMSKIQSIPMISIIKNVLVNDGRVTTAWLFGSTATNDAKPDSDVDIMVELNQNKKYSMFDLLDIAHKIESKINRKVDLVEKGQLKDFAMETASDNLLKIYG